MILRFLPAGDSALLVELPDLDAVLSLFASLTDDPPFGMVELVPAARTLAVTFDRYRTSPQRLAAEITGRDLSARPEDRSREIEIPVEYNGQDLAEVAELTGMTVTEVIRCHGDTPWRAAFNGFAPGFCYLTRGDPALVVPRRQSPRTAIPAGSVALAGEFSGIYPQQSPGGWQIIGTTQMPMWDLSRSPPARIAPGDQVRFVERASRISGPSLAEAASDRGGLPKEMRRPSARLDVINAPFPALFQDSGRVSQLAQGIAASGAADGGALRALNRLLGNPAGTAAVEIGASPLKLRAASVCTLAITGADRRIMVNGKPGFATYAAIAIDPGDEVAISAPRNGCYSYLGARGGFMVNPVLGSAATDTLANIGPPPLRAGDWIGLANRPALALGAAEPVPLLPRPGALIVVDIIPGPRADWFQTDVLTSFTAQDWLVTPRSSRIGKRLEGGKPLLRDDSRELPSEATMTGAIQIPHSGQPVLFLADRPLTGGYPVIATVASRHLDLAAQAPPGAKLRFRARAPFAAITPEAIR